MYAGAQFSVLGPVRLHRQVGEAGTGQPRQCAVLASLLLRAGKPVSLSKLVEDVWGDDARPSAVRSERTYVYRLRQALGEQNDRSVSLVDGGHLLRIQPDALDRNRSKETTAMAREARSIGDLAFAASRLTESLEMWKGVTLAGAQGRSRASSAAPARCVPRRRRGPLQPRNRRNDGNPCGHRDVAHPQRAPAAPPAAAAVHARAVHGVTACHRRGGSQASTVSLLTNQSKQCRKARHPPRVSPFSKYVGNPVRESQHARTAKEKTATSRRRPVDGLVIGLSARNDLGIENHALCGC